MQPANHKGSCKEGPPLAPGGGGGSSVGASVIGNAVKAVIGAITFSAGYSIFCKAKDIFSGSGGRDKRKLDCVSACGSDEGEIAFDLLKRQCIEPAATAEEGEALANVTIEEPAPMMEGGGYFSTSEANGIKICEVGRLLGIHGVNPDGRHVLWFAIGLPKNSIKKRGVEVRFLHELSLDDDPLLYCCEQKDIDVVRGLIVQKTGVRYFGHPAGGRFLKPFRVNVVSQDSIVFPNARYEVLHTWKETKKTDGLNHLFAVHISNEEVARLHETLAINEANIAEESNYTHEFVGKKVMCIFSPGHTTKDKETPLDIATKHNIDVIIIIEANKDKWLSLRADTEFPGGSVVAIGPKTKISGTVASFRPAVDDGDVDLWRVVHDDGDEEDLEYHEIKDAMQRYDNMQDTCS